MQGKNTSSPLTEDVRCDEMKQGTLAEQMDAGRLACDTQSGVMWMAGTGKEMETDLHAKRLIVIPWLS